MLLASGSKVVLATLLHVKLNMCNDVVFMKS